jgi:murein DD-endopeptidase MepM/ murein hydrolase activator NlpD
MANILASAGMTRKEAYRAVKAMKKHYNPRALRPGQNVSIRLKPGEKAMNVAGFRVSIDPARMIRVSRADQGEFNARLRKKRIHRKLHARQITISGSLYGSAARNDIPASVISKAIHVFSWDIDFQRDLHRGDKLKILYARQVTEDGISTGNGKVVYAQLDLQGHSIAAYRYQKRDGDVGYFKPNGHSMRKALMTTPVDGARISSGYGQRKHPVLGYSKMHEGVDFAAPTGTPVYAAGDGVIEKSSRNGSYGNYIRMRHNSRLKTAYAHLSRYADGVNPGKRVEQGEVIGYIGSTGRSTGPHLHYEVMKHGEPVNPQSLDMQRGEILQGDALKRFKNRIGEIKTAYSTHKGDMKYAVRSKE